LADDVKENTPAVVAPCSPNASMQDFIVRAISGTDNLALTSISLPVYQPVTSEVNINLTLMPTEQTDGHIDVGME